MAIPMPPNELVYFGKPGSFTHIVAKQIVGSEKLVSRETVQEVFDYVKQDKSRRGIVPIENSSGGMILDTVDNLVAEDLDLKIQEEYAINVQLSLLGKKGASIRKIYSHFAPFHHCDKWLKENYPDAERVVVDSTSAAAQHAAHDKHAAAIAPARTAPEYRLDVIHSGIANDISNVTQFFLLGHAKSASKDIKETSLSVVLKNEVGSLCHFLKPFATESINLKRIMSRPIVGQPNNYVFFVGIEASTNETPMKKAMEEARRHCTEIRLLGSYPVHPPFES